MLSKSFLSERYKYKFASDLMTPGLDILSVWFLCECAYLCDDLSI